jgi:hypothetical protein
VSLLLTLLFLAVLNTLLELVMLCCTLTDSSHTDLVMQAAEELVDARKLSGFLLLHNKMWHVTPLQCLQHQLCSTS